MRAVSKRFNQNRQNSQFAHNFITRCNRPAPRSGQRLYVLTNKPEYTVGRDNADLLVANDQSISREHAKIQCLATCIKVVDTKSKYGVFVNDGIQTTTAIAKNKPVRLAVGDTVRFGRIKAIFRVEKIDVKVCTSTLDEAEIERLKSHLQLIGGKVESAWSVNCTHLVMPAVTVTVKVLQSLAHGTPIVVPDYFVRYVQSAQANEAHVPDVNEFVPDINEPYIKREPQMMHVHLERQRMFQNKTFVFMVKRQMANFKPIIELAGGKCTNLQEDRIRKTALLRPDHIPVQYTPSSNTQCSEDVAVMADYIIQNGRRLISDSEIGLSIIHRSIKSFCNPDHKVAKAFDVDSGTASELHAHALVGATPHFDMSADSDVEEVHVPETIENTDEESNNNNEVMAIELDSGSTSAATNEAFEMPAPSTRRVTRRSAEKAASAHRPNDSIESAGPKRKHNDSSESVGSKRKHNDSTDSVDAEKAGPSRALIPSKKQKLVDAIDFGASSQSTARVTRVSGFISTQNRFKQANKNECQQPSGEDAQPKRHENATEKRKRIVSLLNSDDDDEGEHNNEPSGNLFCFSRKQVAKRSKPNGEQANTISLNSDDDDDDDDDGNMFNFARGRKGSQAHTKTKKTAQNRPHASTSHEPAASDTQDSFTKPYQHVLNRSTFVPLTMPRAEKISTDWITIRAEKLDLNKRATMPAIRIKKEKLDEDEMTDVDRKRRFVDSVRNGFEMRSIDVNRSRCDRRQLAMVDETDAAPMNSGDSALNRSKNFKCFVKVRLKLFRPYFGSYESTSGHIDPRRVILTRKKRDLSVYLNFLLGSS